LQYVIDYLIVLSVWPSMTNDLDMLTKNFHPASLLVQFL
jgi:hypothetical protein